MSSPILKGHLDKIKELFLGRLLTRRVLKLALYRKLSYSVPVSCQHSLDAALA
jgi:hypothetical protein